MDFVATGARSTISSTVVYLVRPLGSRRCRHLGNVSGAA